MNLRKTDGVDNRAPTARRPARTRLTSALGGGYNSPWKQERVWNGSGTGSRLRCLTASIRAPQRRGPALTSLSAWPSAPEKSVPGPVRPLVLGTLLAVAAALGACGRVAPQFEPANLTVTSTPAGAAILLDGIDTGQVTPYRFTGLEATTHEVRLILDEWFSDPEFIPVDLRPLDDVEIDFALLQTGVRVTSEPAGARIVVDGIDTGRVTPATVGGLQPGPVQISLALDTWLCVPESREVTVVEGEVVEVPAADLRLRSRRTVLLESFGNVSCATCADAAENLVTLTATPGYGAERAVYLEFSVSWPNPIDPFYQANPGENADRYTYYYVLGAPALYVNGSALADPLNLGQSTAAVAAQWADDPGFLIDVATRPGVGGALTVTATLTPADRPGPDRLHPVPGVVRESGHLRVAAGQQRADGVPPHVPRPRRHAAGSGDAQRRDAGRVRADAQPGHRESGKRHDRRFRATGRRQGRAPGWIHRRHAGGREGAPFPQRRKAVMKRSPLPRSVALAVLAALLTMATGAAAQNSFTWSIADRGSVSPLDVLTAFHTDIINTGTVADTYQVTLVADMPTSWLTTMCDVRLCYPPFITTLQYTVAPGDTLYVGVNITPMVDSGRGTSTVTVASTNVPSLSVTAGFTVLTTGAQVLVVDADGGSGTEVPVLAAVAASGRTMGLWDRAASGKLAAADLGAFEAVVWQAGDNALGLDADDRAALAAYVAGGGRLLLGGADLANQVCNPASPGYAPAAVAWYASTLGTGFVANSSGTFAVSGAPGDPVGGGLAFSIGDGGANPSPDVLTPAGGTTCLLYAGGQTSAVRFQSGGGRTVCLGFGPNGITDTAARQALVDAALDWLAADASSVPVPGAAAPLGLSAAPNPFNPRTTLWLDNGGTGALAGALDIFDLRGRQVRTLRTGTLAPGRTALSWDGRDDRGRPLPGGTYVARLSAAGTPPVTIKLMLAK